MYNKPLFFSELWASLSSKFLIQIILIKKPLWCLKKLNRRHWRCLLHDQFLSLRFLIWLKFHKSNICCKHFFFSLKHPSGACKRPQQDKDEIWIQGQFNLPSCGSSKNLSSRERVKPCFFPKNLIEISQVVQKIWRFSSSILSISINFLDFLTFPCYKETNDDSI